MKKAKDDPATLRIAQAIKANLQPQEAYICFVYGNDGIDITAAFCSNIIGDKPRQRFMEMGLQALRGADLGKIATPVTTINDPLEEFLKAREDSNVRKT